MPLSIRQGVMIAVSLMIIGIVLPLGLAYLSGAGDMYVVVGGVNQTLSEWVDPSVLTVLTILIPILAVIGIAITYIQTTQ